MHGQFRRRLASTSVLASVSLQCPASTYHVSASAPDELGSGSMAQPRKTLRAGVALVGNPIPVEIYATIFANGFE